MELGQTCLFNIMHWGGGCAVTAAAASGSEEASYGLPGFRGWKTKGGTFCCTLSQSLSYRTLSMGLPLPFGPLIICLSVCLSVISTVWILGIELESLGLLAGALAN